MSLLPPPTTTITYSIANTLPFLPPSLKPPQYFVYGKRNHLYKPLSRNATNSDQNPSPDPIIRETSLGNLDRRNVLLGLGGLYSAANFGSDALTLAAPIVTPDPTKCGAANFPAGATPTDCCPPLQKVIDFKLPPPPKVMRVRPAAQFASADYIAKYEKATAHMKALPKDDPRNFTQQANIHCAYCDSAYEQVGFPDLKIDVHFSWIFFPFHRWYLYFYEKILGKLIDDPTFALPFWNWDSSAGGMLIPSMFTNSNSPLYDSLRDSPHQPPTLIDLNYSGTDSGIVGDQLIKNNLSIMYRQMVSGSKTPLLFHGSPYRAGGEQDPGMGAIENTPHTQVHRWTGDRTQPNGEDMGRFYSAGRDPIFYAHHSNVDRMWAIWKTLPGGKRKDFTDPDWLNSSFIFSDENAQLVRVKVKDCLDIKKLGYGYQDVEIPWLKTRPTPRKQKKNKAGVANAAEMPKTGNDFPIILDKAVKVMVTRPKKSRSRREKEEEEEILVVDGIEFDRDEFVKFDVFVNEDDEAASGPDKTELAGSFANVPHKGKNGMKVRTCLRLGVGELLEDLEAEDDESLLVTLVPRAGSGRVSIGGVKIELDS